MNLPCYAMIAYSIVITPEHLVISPPKDLASNADEYSISILLPEIDRTLYSVLLCLSIGPEKKSPRDTTFSFKLDLNPLGIYPL